MSSLTVNSGDVGVFKNLVYFSYIACLFKLRITTIGDSDSSSRSDEIVLLKIIS